jgi:uncharacterized protein
MRFTEESSSGINLIRAYRAGEVRINEAAHRGAVIVSATTVSAEPDVHDLDQLLALPPTRILALEPELVLLGTGQRQIFPPAAYAAHFLRMSVGFEVMDTGAACRTFNVLVAEQRRVVALLLT